MSKDYVVLFDENGKPYVAHSAQGSVNSGVRTVGKATHKYLLKVGEGAKARYAYTKEEVDALLGRGKRDSSFLSLKNDNMQISKRGNGSKRNVFQRHNSESLRNIKNNLQKNNKRPSAGLDINNNNNKVKTNKEKRSNRTSYSEYKENDRDFDEKNYSEKNRVGDTDFYMFKGNNGQTVIVEEDMKWTLPAGVDVNSSKVRSAIEKYSLDAEKHSEDDNWTNADFIDGMSNAINKALANEKNSLKSAGNVKKKK